MTGETIGGAEAIAAIIEGAAPVDPSADGPANGAAAETGPEGGESPAKAPEPKRKRAAKKAPAAGGGDDGGPVEPRDMGYSCEEINREYALVLLGSKAVVYNQSDVGPIEDERRVLTLEAFHVWFANRFTQVRGYDGEIKIKTWSHRWISDRNRLSYRGVEFFPDPEMRSGTPGYLNLWSGFAVKPDAKAGTWSILRDHILNNLCRGDETLFRWVIAFFAHMVQCPRDRPGVALVMRGRQGAGKTTVGEAVGSLFPRHFFLIDDPRYVTGQFNAHMASCLLLQADEAVWAGDKAAEGRLRGLVTSSMQQVESKGVDPIRLKNYVRLIMTSNEDWIVPAGKDERRFCVLDVHPRCAQNHQYFTEMSEELNNGGREALLADLLAFDLSAVNLRQIPRTGALLEQKIRSLDSVDAWWFERLWSGTSTRKSDAWVLRVPREDLFDDYIEMSEKIGIKRKVEAQILGTKLRKLVPGLKDTRPWLDRAPGRTERVRCYDFPSLADCRAAFEEALQQPVDWPADDPEAHPADSGWVPD